MHIDLLEGWRGQGWGWKIIKAFVASVRDAVREGGGDVLDCGRGEHIGVVWRTRNLCHSTRGLGFRMHEAGQREGGTIWMVYEFAGEATGGG